MKYKGIAIVSALSVTVLPGCFWAILLLRELLVYEMKVVSFGTFAIVATGVFGFVVSSIARIWFRELNKIPNKKAEGEV